MRNLACLTILALLNTLAIAQSTSPDALYERGIDAVTGVGPLLNEQQGVDYFRRSADLGYAPAQVALGYYYETGAIVGGDASRALDLYRKAALPGDPLAAWLAGRLLLLGAPGVTRDPEAARKLLKMAADQNNAFGAYYLGRLMDDRDAAKAAALYKIGADQGLPQAQYFYGKSLKDGRGIAQDRASAYIWLTISSDAGYAAAGADIAEIEKSGALLPDQFVQARSKAHDMEQIVIRAVTSRGCSGREGEFAELPTPPPPRLQRFCH